MSFRFLAAYIAGVTFFVLAVPVLILLRRPSRASWIALYGYALILLTMLSAGDGAIPDARISAESANLLRAGVHALAAGILLVPVIRRGIRTPAPATLAALAGLAWMAVSIIAVHEIDTASVLRLAVLAAMLLNVFVFIPSLRWRPQDLSDLSRALSVVAIGASLISVYAIYRFGYYPVWSLRLGRPLNPNVLAFLLTIALIASFVRPRQRVLQLVLLIGILLSGSRLNIALALVTVAAMLAQGRGIGRRRVFGAAVLAGIIGTLFALPDRFFTRSSLLSGREDLWSDSWPLILEHPWFGSAGRVVLEEGQRAHNIFIEQSLSFGIPLAACSLALYLTLLFSARTRAASVMAFAMLAAGLVSTASWTNLGDGGTLMALSFILIASASRPRPPQRLDQPLRSAAVAHGAQPEHAARLGR